MNPGALVVVLRVLELLLEDDYDEARRFLDDVRHHKNALVKRVTAGELFDRVEDLDNW